MKKLIALIALLIIVTSTAISQTVCPPNVAAITVYYTKPVTLNQVLDTLTVCDADNGDTHTWTTPSGNTSGLWGLTTSPGKCFIKVANASVINNGTATSYTFTIQVTDNGTAPPGQLSSQTVMTMTEKNGQPVIAAQGFSIAENTTVGTTIGTVVASDPNAQPLTYSITSGNSAGFFAINAITGVLSVAKFPINYEFLTSYPIVVQVVDTGTVPLSASATMSISITNMNEIPVIY